LKKLLAHKPFQKRLERKRPGRMTWLVSPSGATLAFKWTNLEVKISALSLNEPVRYIALFTVREK